MSSLGKKLGKIVIPLATPFKEGSQEINFTVAGELADFVIERKYCDSLAVAGTSGEFNTMSVEERFELFACVRDAVKKRVPLVAGACASSTRDAVRLARKAEELEYDAVMAVGPFYCKPTQQGIYEHFRSVAASTSLPVLLYNIPIFTGMNVAPDTVRRLAAIGNIKGIKDEAGINPT